MKSLAMEQDILAEYQKHHKIESDEVMCRQVAAKDWAKYCAALNEQNRLAAPNNNFDRIYRLYKQVADVSSGNKKAMLNIAYPELDEAVQAYEGAPSKFKSFSELSTVAGML